jgi:hypothetical protein
MRVVAVMASCGLLLVACGSGSEAGQSPTTTIGRPAPTPGDRSTSATKRVPSTAPTGTGIKTAASDLGVILFDSTGQAIYLFAKEKSRAPACYGPCADAWPPVLTTGPPKALGGAKQSLLATTNRTDAKPKSPMAGTRCTST